jgi:hypothetical protein
MWIRDPRIFLTLDPGSGMEKIRNLFIFKFLYYPLVAETMIMMRMTATTTPMMIIILMFCHQYFRFSLVA